MKMLLFSVNFALQGTNQTQWVSEVIVDCSIGDNTTMSFGIFLTR